MTIGETLSTGGSGAQGDLAGAGAGDFDTKVGFPLSVWPLDNSPPCLIPPAAECAPGFRIVLVPPVRLGPVELGLDSDGVVGFDSSAGLSSFFASGFGSSKGGVGSAGLTVDLVPSIHSTVSGAQLSSSSSSMSAHFDSFWSSSACNLVAMWMPNCCFSSSSVNCFGGGGGVAEHSINNYAWKKTSFCAQHTSILIPDHIGVWPCSSSIQLR